MSDDLAVRLAEQGLLAQERGVPYVLVTVEALDLMIQLVETAEAVVNGQPPHPILGYDPEQTKAIDRFLGIRKQVFG